MREIDDLLERYARSAMDQSEEETPATEGSSLKLKRTDSLIMVVMNDTEGLVYLPSFTKVQEVADVLMRGFRAEQAMLLHSLKMCRYLLRCIETRLGVGHTFITLAMEMHWGEHMVNVKWATRETETNNLMQEALYRVFTERPHGPWRECIRRLLEGERFPLLSRQ